jgi:uncharacterized membrane protein YqjE
MPDQSSSELARAIQDVTEKAQLLVREEIALAKAEMTEKTKKLAVGAAFGAVAGAFALFALIYLFEALAWAINDLLNVSTALWAGFLITGAIVLVLGLIAGLIAMRQIKKGSPPTPQMAIEEAQLIKGTLTASPAGHAVGPVGARQAPTPAPTEGRR